MSGDKIRKTMLEDDSAVEGLPVRLIVVLVIGVIALAGMVSALNGFKPQKSMSASVIEVSAKDGNMMIIEKAGFGAVNKTWTCKVKVVDTDGNPVDGANVIVYGLTGAGSETTNKSGVAYLTKTNDVRLNANQNSGYLTLEVSAPGFNTYKNENAMAVIRAD